jgi:hypothetical protein
MGGRDVELGVVALVSRLGIHRVAADLARLSGC